MRPIIQDVEGFTLVNAEGAVLRVSRSQNPELFKLAIGGYGLFGIIATVDLRLTKRVKLQRVVEILPIGQLSEKAEDFMKLGVFSTYRPVPDDTPMPQVKQKLTPEKWHKFLPRHRESAEEFPKDH